MHADIEKRQAAFDIVYKYVVLSAGAGVIQVPGVDVTVLAGVHIALIKELSDRYSVVFSKHTARNILIAIGAGLVPGAIGSVLGRRLLKALPFISPPMVVLTASAAAGAVSYGLGRIFIHHFESGGSLDSFDIRNLHRIVPWLKAHAAA